MSPSKAHNYYQIIKRPIDLSVIRRKLDETNTLHYFSVEQFIDDVLLMFKNCATFNYVSGKTYHWSEKWPSDAWFLFFCRAARLRSRPGWSKPGEVLPEAAEGGFSWPDVCKRQPGDDEQSPSAVAPQEEGQPAEEEMLLQGPQILSDVKMDRVFYFSFSLDLRLVSLRMSWT